MEARLGEGAFVLAEKQHHHGLVRLQLAEADGQDAGQQQADDGKNGRGFVVCSSHKAPNAQRHEGDFDKQSDESVHRKSLEFKFFCFHR